MNKGVCPTLKIENSFRSTHRHLIMKTKYKLLKLEKHIICHRSLQCEKAGVRWLSQKSTEIISCKFWDAETLCMIDFCEYGDLDLHNLPTRQFSVQVSVSSLILFGEKNHCKNQWWKSGSPNILLNHMWNTCGIHTGNLAFMINHCLGHVYSIYSYRG